MRKQSRRGKAGFILRKREIDGFEKQKKKSENRRNAEKSIDRAGTV